MSFPFLKSRLVRILCALAASATMALGAPALASASTLSYAHGTPVVPSDISYGRG